MTTLSLQQAYRMTGVLLGLMFLCMPVLASAASVIRSGDTVSVAEDQMVSGDFYAAGGTVSVSGVIEGDLYVAGGTVTVNGRVVEDITAVGGTVSIQYPVGDDLRVVGGQVTVAERVSGDLVVIGGSLSVLSTAVIEGDLIFYGGEVDINGDVGGSIHVGADVFRIDSAVAGDINATIGDQLILGPTSNVEGNITYRSMDELVRAPGSVVVGDMTRSDLYEVSVTHPTDRFPVFQFFTTLFATLVLLLLFGDHIKKLTGHIRQSFGMYGLIGLGVFFVTPIVALLLMVSILGVLAGGLVMAAYVSLLLVAWMLTGICVGALISHFFIKEHKINWFWTLIGVSFVHLIAAIPFLGPLAIFAVFLMSVGGLSSVLYKSFR